MRRLFLAYLGLCTGAGAAACSAVLGDFAVSTSGAGDSGAGADSTGPADAAPDAYDAPSGACQAVASASDVYVAQSAAVDGSKSTGDSLSYTWTVESAPSGSGVSTASLQGAGSAAATFVADVPGDYQLALAIASASCAGSSAHVTVTARSPRVVFAQGQVSDAGASAAYVVADLDGGNRHPLLCPDSIVTPVPNEIATLAAYAGRAYDFWEAPSGQPSKYAAFTVDYAADAYSTHLWVGTTDSSCRTPPADLTSTGFGPAPSFGSEPHFNPDGSRFVVYDAQWNIVTYSSDGSPSGRRVVAAYGAGQSGPPAFDASFDPVSTSRPDQPPRVEWTATGLAWARASAMGWEIVTAPDLEGSVPTSYMRCTGVTPRQIALLRDGTVIAGYRQVPDGGEDIYLLKPNLSQTCVVEQKYTSSSDAGTATATDFAVSPDGRWLAYLALDPTMQDAAPWAVPNDRLYPGGFVYVVRTAVPDGGAPQPMQVSTEPALYGPRWIGGGTLLAFTRLDHASGTSAPATSVVVVAPDGGGEMIVARGDGVRSFVSTSSAGCAVGARGAGGAGVFAGLAAMALITGLSRRKRGR